MYKRQEQKRVDGRRDMDEREYFGPSRIALKPEQLTNKAENEKDVYKRQRLF